MAYQRITVIRAPLPAHATTNEKLLWLGGSLGLFNARDKDKSCFRVFVTLVKEPQGLSSDDIAEQLRLTRGTVVHHLNKLMHAGIAEHGSGTYALRRESLHELINELDRNTQRTLTELKMIAEELDKTLKR